MSVPYTKCGKCGNTVWQRNRYGQISYPYHVPTYRNTAAQRLVRGVFAIVSARWRTLTEAQRQAWIREAWFKKTRRRLGKCHRLTGFNYFVRVNVALANRGLPQLDLPPFEPLDSKLSQPLLTERLILPLGEYVLGCSLTSGRAAGPAPPPGG